MRCRRTKWRLLGGFDPVSMLAARPPPTAPPTAATCPAAVVRQCAQRHTRCLVRTNRRCSRCSFGLPCSELPAGVRHRPLFWLCKIDRGGLFFSDASTGFPGSRQAWLQTKENPARGVRTPIARTMPEGWQVRNESGWAEMGRKGERRCQIIMKREAQFPTTSASSH